MSALSQWMDETRAEVKMADGHILGVVPIRFADCIAARAIPLPVLEEMARLESAEGEEAADAAARFELLKEAHAINDTYVQLSIVSFDNEIVEMSLEATRRLGATDPDAYAEVLALATRQVPTPGKE